jgi:hypothetical protein
MAVVTVTSIPTNKLIHNLLTFSVDCIMHTRTTADTYEFAVNGEATTGTDNSINASALPRRRHTDKGY